jgi:hypothetical protein
MAAAPDFSVALRIFSKALSLNHNGHWVRSHEKVGQALDAALAQGCPDCLIVARLQLHHARSAVCPVVHRAILGTPAYQARREAALTQVLEAAATIQRRKAAGTLFGASCTAAELAWTRHAFEQVARLQHNSVALERAGESALHCGFDTLLQCADTLICAVDDWIMGAPVRVHLPEEQERACWTLVTDAVHCMMAHRSLDLVAQPIEGNFVRNLQMLLRGWRGCVVPCEGAGGRLRRALRQLQRSRVLEQRNIERGIALDEETGNRVRQAYEAACADPGLRSCGLASCSAREAHPSHFKSCSACRIPAYCCKEHQSEDWPSHKAACKAARKAAEQTTVLMRAKGSAA